MSIFVETGAMLEFQWFRALGGEHTLMRELRRTEYELTPSQGLLTRVLDEYNPEDFHWAFEHEVMRGIRQVFSLPPEGDPGSYLSGVDIAGFSMMTKQSLRKVQMDRWIERGKSFVRRDSSAGFLMMAYQIGDTEGDYETYYFEEKPNPPDKVLLSFAWSQIGAASSLFRATYGREEVGAWQIRMEEALRQPGWGVKTVRDWLQ